MINRTNRWVSMCQCLALVLVISVTEDCGRGKANASSTAKPAASSPAEPARTETRSDGRGRSPAAPPNDEIGSLMKAWGLGDALASRKTRRRMMWPEGLIVGEPCPTADDAAAKEAEDQKHAIVPLQKHLTLSVVWRPLDGDYDIECLTQVTDVGPAGTKQSSTCNYKDRIEGGSRSTCRSDLRTAYMIHTAIGTLHPEQIIGATEFSLSAASFGQLKSQGATRHRHVTVTPDYPLVDLDGELKSKGSGTLAVVVNDKVVDLPVIKASGTMHGLIQGQQTTVQLDAAILDDARFPLVLDYRVPGVNQAFITYMNISYPAPDTLEQHLLAEKRVDVYGIYFDFASDRIRKESEPIIDEIVDVMSKHPDWTLSIEGHTDNVGGSASNLDLSRRRSDSVKKALVSRGIADSRLTTSGFGANAPKDTNDTVKGRARNRRVELVRR